MAGPLSARTQPLNSNYTGRYFFILTSMTSPACPSKWLFTNYGSLKDTSKIQHVLYESKQVMEA